MFEDWTMDDNWARRGVRRERILRAGDVGGVACNLRKYVEQVEHVERLADLSGVFADFSSNADLSMLSILPVVGGRGETSEGREGKKQPPSARITTTSSVPWRNPRGFPTILRSGDPCLGMLGPSAKGEA